MKFSILTQPICGYQKFKYNIKNIIKNILKIKTFGPTYVLESIFKGLEELKNEGEKISYNVNPKEKDINPIVFVPIGIETLKYAINLKKKGIIKSIIAGPNISVPKDKNDIFFNSSIDCIITPSQWVKEYFLSLSKNNKRIKNWTAGIPILDESKKGKNILIFYKYCPQEILNHIEKYLLKNKYKFKILKYGTFKKEDYMKLLGKSYMMIYLQETETQGIALNEAWMKNIPTLIWNRGYWEYNNSKWEDEKISAPYLTKESGLFFSGIEHFEEKFNEFNLKINTFEARKYALKKFTFKKSTIDLLNIIKNYE